MKSSATTPSQSCKSPWCLFKALPLTFLSLSEYGCITNERKFEEVSALYDEKMTSVYSGGLVYEWSEEGSGYGLVKINGDSVTEKSDYTALQQAFSNTKAPSGDGGAKTDGEASECPSQSDSWDVKDFTGQQLPAIPEKAKQYMSDGDGKGPGLDGSGSQNAGKASTGTATPGSGSVTAVATNTASGSSSGSSSSSSGEASSSASPASAANALIAGDLGFAPFACGAIVLVSSVFGAALL